MILSLMARLRTILWVDDEIETLDSQLLFLEQNGFTVERAANGDDALALLRA
jgi:DNA-binding response OmpR family regulator